MIMPNELELVETIEDIEDAIEDVVDVAEDLGLINSTLASRILSNVSLSKKYILLAIPVIVTIVIMVQSL